jgi:hypothetical protein
MEYLKITGPLMKYFALYVPLQQHYPRIIESRNNIGQCIKSIQTIMKKDRAATEEKIYKALDILKRRRSSRRRNNAIAKGSWVSKH